MTVSSPPTFRQRHGRKLVTGAILLTLAGAGAGAYFLSQTENDTTAGTPVFTVAQGPLTISVSEAGTITARDQVVIASAVQGRRSIIYLVPEGRRVQAGELLVELDSSALETDLGDQDIRLQNSDASLIQAQEEHAVVKSQAQSDISKAELTFRFAQDDLKKYIEGEYPKQLQEADTQITLKEEALKQAEDTLIWSERLFENRYISESELTRDRLAARRAKLEMEMAEREMALLTDYTHQRQLAQLESDVEQSEMALERTRRSARASVVQAEARLRARQAEYTRELRRKEHLEAQIANCRMIAPVAGMVVYATTGQGSWRGNAEPLAEGQEVRERQELIHLPTASAMQAEVKVHESMLDRVAVGMPVRVNVDALPGRTFSGRVRRIAPLPDAQSIWLNPDLKVYSTNIELDGELDDVRTGMTCRAEILIDRYQDATYIPIQSVVRVGRQPTVYVRSGPTFEARPVTLGLNNNRMVRIVEGVSPGEVVSLAPPLSPASVEDDEAAFAAAADFKRRRDAALADQAASPTTPAAEAADTAQAAASAAAPAPAATEPATTSREGRGPRGEHRQTRSEGAAPRLERAVDTAGAARPARPEAAVVPTGAGS